MWVALACLALGTAAMALVGGVRVSVEHGIDAQRRALLGGDLVIESPDPIPDAVRDVLIHAGGHVIAGVRMRSMLYGPSSARLLVEAEGVEPGWPLVGHATLAPKGTIGTGIAGNGLLAEPIIADRLHLHAGDTVSLGGYNMIYHAALAGTPDGGSVALAPRVIVALPDLQSAGLIRPGMLATWSLHAAWTGDGANRTQRVRAVEHELAVRFPGVGWHVRDVRDAAAGLSRLVTELGQFMALLGLTALLLGGLGVSSGVAAWMRGRRRTIAILSSLGASQRLVAQIMAAQIGLLCGAGVVAGAIAGAVIAIAVVRLSAAVLPVAPADGAIALSALFALLIGGLTALLFASPSVMRGLAAPPATLFRDDVSNVERPRRIVAVSTAIGIALFVIVVATAQDRIVALGFLGAMLVVLGVFAGLGAGLRRIAHAASRRSTGVVRLALSFIGRAQGPAPRLVLALGAGLSGLAAIWIVDGALQAQFAETMPRTAPSFYFVDIQPGDVPTFEAIVHRMPFVQDMQTLPSMRTRVVGVNGVPAERVAASARTRWALRGDHGLTIEPHAAAGTDITSGRWWSTDYDGPPLLSLDAGLAEGWGAGVGSRVTLNVLGRDIDFRVASLRHVQWQSLQMNFAFIASPGLLSHAPHTVIATLRTDGSVAHDADLLAAVTDALPGVTGIRVADVLAVLSNLVGKLALALSAMAGVMLVSGVLVLIATLLAGRPERMADGAVLRALGASDAQLRQLWFIEFLFIGAVAGVGAGCVGILLADVVLREVLFLPMAIAPLRIVAVVVLSLLVMFGAGQFALRAMLSARPASLLRGR
ncbi:ABC transporter permease [Tanticharoenia sakaeratensis]|uniref:ABC3 transporter permease C-terminal domain-containing protein n=1 Tax=Tanticharoenia sakaeratensis NBRC 103193 TaxID=1231623 RepID=A0A0D6MHG1_9PROT|nr:FtsX-like permease family protein [Tanticharoenia sakaeratensis]GAN52936.1 hypothetical protein Tasa_004_001 [Tanticharoenia sakaeratensis NBRC 103193]GBQ19978.1 putative ABC transporter permease [Tanticharoenia sakaeratensis NBRC 103193]